MQKHSIRIVYHVGLENWCKNKPNTFVQYNWNGQKHKYSAWRTHTHTIWIAMIEFSLKITETKAKCMHLKTN